MNNRGEISIGNLFWAFFWLIGLGIYFGSEMYQGAVLFLGTTTAQVIGVLLFLVPIYILAKPADNQPFVQFG